MPNLNKVRFNGTDYDIVKDELDRKAEIDGVFEGMTVGNAEQLVSTVFIDDQVPYQFRTSGGSVDIGNREYNTIVGGTVAWNQLVPNGNFAETGNWGATNGTLTIADGKATVTYDASTKPRLYQKIKASGEALAAYHKHLILCDISNTTSDNIAIGISSSNLGGTAMKKRATSTAKTTISVINIPTETALSYVVVGFSNSSSDVASAAGSFTVENFRVYDLTQMFGTTIADYIYDLDQATAGAGFAFFRKLFPKDYYPYDAGTLKSVEGLSSHETVGFNAWDEEWELGRLSNGANASSTTMIRSKNYIPCLPSTTYYGNAGDDNGNMWAAFYDADKTVINPSTNGTLIKNTTFVTPANARFMRFFLSDTTTYKNDVCINLSWDGERNGEYEEYMKHSYPLDDSLTLRGILKFDAQNRPYYDGDRYESDGTVTRRYGIVDLGTLNWTYSPTYQYFGSGSVTNRKAGSLNLITAKYVTGTQTGQANISDKMITSGTNTIDIVIRDLDYTDATDFKTAMSGVYLIYELAESTTETADSYQSPQVVDDFGTEEYVTTSIVPVGHYTRYASNLRAKLEMLPESPDGDGDYIVRQVNGENAYVPLVIPRELPTLPTSNGTYKLKVTVADGEVTMSWEAE